MAAGVTYQLVATDAAALKWKVSPDVTLVKRSQAAATATASGDLRITKAYWFHSPDRPKWIRAEKVPKDGSGHLLMHVEHDIDPAELWPFYSNIDKQFVFKSVGHPDVRARAERGYWGASEFYIRIAERDLSKMVEGVTYELAVTTADTNWRVEPGVSVVKHGDNAITDEPSPVATPADHVPRQLTLTKAYWADSPQAPTWIRVALSKQRFTARRMLLLHVNGKIGSDTLKEFTKVVDREFLLTADGRSHVSVEAGIGSICSQENCEIVVFVPEQRYQQLARGVSYRVQPLNGRQGYEWIVGADVTVNRESED